MIGAPRYKPVALTFKAHLINYLLNKQAILIIQVNMEALTAKLKIIRKMMWFNTKMIQNSLQNLL